MYAIAGIISQNYDVEIMDNMLKSICPAKDTSSDIYADGNCILGSKLISKRFKEDILGFGDNMVVLSGKIYNYKQLKEELEDLGVTFVSDNDSELISKGYTAWGSALVQKLNGIFAFAVWDNNNKELFLARDPFGVKTLYYSLCNNSFVFSSGLKAFLSFPDYHKELNEEILSSYLCFNSVATNETFFKGVYRLEPGHYLTFKDNQMKKECYFRPLFHPEQQDLAELTDKINSAVENSVLEQTKGDNCGSFLSSGVDSSYIVSILKPENTYTVGYSDTKYDETIYSTELANALGISNKVKLVSAKEYLDNFSAVMCSLDEPLANPSVPALYLGVIEAAKDVDVILSGEGADELFGGYLSYDDENAQSWYSKIPFAFRRIAYKIADILPESSGLNFVWRKGQRLEEHHIGLGRVFRDKDAMALLKNKNQIRTKDITAPYYEQFKDCSALQKRQAIDYYFWLINDFVFAVVKSAEALGIEARFPILCKELCDVAMHLTDDMKLNCNTTKYAFRLAAEKVIPTDAHKKKKLGFPVPLKEWIKDDLFYNDIKEKFKSSVAEKFFNKKKILRLLELHKSGKKDCYKKIWAIYSFIVWYNNFF